MQVSLISIIFLSIIGIFIFFVIAYWFYYRFSINKSLHSEKPKKNIPPKNIIISILAILLVISIGFSIFIITGNPPQISESNFFTFTYEEQRGGVFDALFNDKDLAVKNGYKLNIWQENGFEVRELSCNRYINSLIPNNLIRVSYIENLPELEENEKLEIDFIFLNKNDELDNANFSGYGFVGAYKPVYIAYNYLGRFSVKITAELKIKTDKTDVSQPFATMVFQKEIMQ